MVSYLNPNFGAPYVPTQPTISARSQSILDAYRNARATSYKRPNPQPPKTAGTATRGLAPTLGAATIAAQQALSEKFGIPTFNLTGGISTIPLTRAIDPTINVGVGSFQGTREQFNQALADLTPKSESVAAITDSLKSAIGTLSPLAIAAGAGLIALLVLRK